MLWLVRNPDGEPVAVHRTFLSKDCKSKAPIDDCKRLLGKPGPGAAVRLTPAEGDTLAVCEGVKTGLSIVIATKCSVWCLTSSSAFQKFVPPANIKTIVIAADNDEAGLKAANEMAANKLHSKGITVRIAKPPKEGQDFNDLLKAEGKEAVSSVIDSVKPWEPPRPPEKESEPSGNDNDKRPRVEVIDDKQHCTTDEVIAVMARDPTLFQRDRKLVRVVRAALPPVHESFAADRIDALPLPVLQDRISACVALYRVAQGKDGDEARPCAPPKWLVESLLARGNWPGVRPISAVVNSAVLSRDGELLNAPGYDSRSGLFVSHDAVLPDVPERPTREDVARAVAALREVVSDFPFTSDAYFAAWVASILSVVARDMIAGPIPMFIITANVRGAGKGLLAAVAGIIATGAPPPVSVAATSDEEWRKRISSIVLRGDRVALLDNLTGAFGCGAIDALLTSVKWTDRLLGTNETIEAPMKTVWMATGNNVELRGDTARRTCWVRLESNMERPEERENFRHRDLLAWVRQERTRLLAAALTVVRGWVVNDKPDQGLKPWGSFDAWTNVIRNAVVWAGLPDPGECRASAEIGTDPAAEAMALVVAAMARTDPGDLGVYAADLYRAVFDEPNGQRPGPSDAYDDLRDAFETLFGAEGGKRSPYALGRLLSKYRGRRLDGGKYLDHGDKGRRGVRWYIRNDGAKRDDGDDGDDGPTASVTTKSCENRIPDHACDDVDDGDDVSLRARGVHEQELLQLLSVPRRRKSQPEKRVLEGTTFTRGWPPRPPIRVWYRDRAGNVRECRDQWPMPGEIEYHQSGMIAPQWAEVPKDWLRQPPPNPTNHV